MRIKVKRYANVLCKPESSKQVQMMISDFLLPADLCPCPAIGQCSNGILFCFPGMEITCFFKIVVLCDI